MARINLLPWREEERTRKLYEFIALLGFGFFIALLISIGIHFYANNLIEQQKERNSLLDEEIKKLDTKIKAIQELEKKKNSLIARMNIIQSLQESRPEIVHLFDELVNATPEGLYLTGITQNGRTLTIKGMAQSNARVSAYMRNIDASNWIGKAVLGVIQQTGSNKNSNNGEDYSSFLLTAQQIDKRAKEPDNFKSSKRSKRSKR